MASATVLFQPARRSALTNRSQLRYRAASRAWPSPQVELDGEIASEARPWDRSRCPDPRWSKRTSWTGCASVPAQAGHRLARPRLRDSTDRTTSRVPLRGLETRPYARTRRGSGRSGRGRSLGWKRSRSTPPMASSTWTPYLPAQPIANPARVRQQHPVGMANDPTLVGHAFENAVEQFQRRGRGFEMRHERRLAAQQHLMCRWRERRQRPHFAGERQPVGPRAFRVIEHVAVTAAHQRVADLEETPHAAEDSDVGEQGAEFESRAVVHATGSMCAGSVTKSVQPVAARRPVHRSRWMVHEVMRAVGVRAVLERSVQNVVILTLGMAVRRVVGAGVELQQERDAAASIVMAQHLESHSGRVVERAPRERRRIEDRGASCATHAGLTFLPGLRCAAGVERHHRDAVRHRTDEHAQVATDAVVFLHPRNAGGVRRAAQESVSGGQGA